MPSQWIATVLPVLSAGGLAVGILLAGLGPARTGAAPRQQGQAAAAAIAVAIGRHGAAHLLRALLQVGQRLRLRGGGRDVLPGGQRVAGTGHGAGRVGKPVRFLAGQRLELGRQLVHGPAQHVLRMPVGALAGRPLGRPRRRGGRLAARAG